MVISTVRPQGLSCSGSESGCLQQDWVITEAAVKRGEGEGTIQVVGALALLETYGEIKVSAGPGR